MCVFVGFVLMYIIKGDLDVVEVVLNGVLVEIVEVVEIEGVCV